MVRRAVLKKSLKNTQVRIQYPVSRVKSYPHLGNHTCLVFHSNPPLGKQTATPNSTIQMAPRHLLLGNSEETLEPGFTSSYFRSPFTDHKFQLMDNGYVSGFYNESCPGYFCRNLLILKDTENMVPARQGVWKSELPVTYQMWTATTGWRIQNKNNIPSMSLGFQGDWVLRNNMNGQFRPIPANSQWIPHVSSHESITSKNEPKNQIIYLWFIDIWSQHQTDT